MAPVEGQVHGFVMRPPIHLRAKKTIQNCTDFASLRSKTAVVGNLLTLSPI